MRISLPLGISLTIALCILVSLPAQTVKKDSPAKKTEKNKQQKEVKAIKVYANQKLAYRFSKAEYIRFRDSINTQTKDRLHRLNEYAIEWRRYVPKNANIQKEIKQYFIFRDQLLIDSLEEPSFIRFKDSISRQSKDTLFIKANNQVFIHPYDPKRKRTMGMANSPKVAANKKGYITLNLPLAKTRRYHLIFYESDGSILFELKNIKETDLILDKTNFMHAGYFRYELFEDEKLLEKGMVNLQK